MYQIFQGFWQDLVHQIWWINLTSMVFSFAHSFTSTVLFSSSYLSIGRAICFTHLLSNLIVESERQTQVVTETKYCTYNKIRQCSDENLLFLDSLPEFCTLKLKIEIQIHFELHLETLSHISEAESLRTSVLLVIYLDPSWSMMLKQNLSLRA